MDGKIQEIADLLSDTLEAHRQAFIDTGGYDPDWPIWYADYLLDKLVLLLEFDLSKSELIYLLVYLSKVQPVDAPDASWPEYYARYIVDHYP